MSNTRSLSLRPVVSLRALLVVASIVVLSPGVALGKPSVPRPPAVEVTRAANALAYLAPRIEAAALPQINRRIALVQRRLRALQREQRTIEASLRASDAQRAIASVAAYERGDTELAGELVVADTESSLLRGLADRPADGDAEAVAGVELAAERDRLEQLLRGLVEDRAYLEETAARASAARAFVLSGLALPLRQRAMRQARRSAAVEQRSTRRADSLVELTADVPVARTDVAVAASRGINALAVAYALTQIGTPYRTRGMSPETGFDCSGLIYWSYGMAGVRAPRSSYDLWSAGLRIPRRDALPGDIVSFHDQGHTGFYLGGGLYVHSTQSGDVIRVSRISDRRDLDGFIRLENLAG